MITVLSIAHSKSKHMDLETRVTQSASFMSPRLKDHLRTRAQAESSLASRYQLWILTQLIDIFNLVLNFITKQKHFELKLVSSLFWTEKGTN